ncbi:MAG: hypothetical protein LRY40_00205, partial [Shewanella fodinae]|nr:hypothetical protein [Shewanella fodinae]
WRNAWLFAGIKPCWSILISGLKKTCLGKFDRPEEYVDIAQKCVKDFRSKNRGRALCLLSVHDEVLDSRRSDALLRQYYEVIWDKQQSHKFPSLSSHMVAIKAFKKQP